MHLWLFIWPMLLLFFACENSTEEIAKYDLSKSYPEQEIKNVELLYTSNGELLLKLNAPVLHQYGGEKPYNEMPEGVHLQLFDSAKNVSTNLTSDYAIDLSHANKMEARNNVVVINEKGEKLNTEHLVWDKKTAKFTSDVFVTITTENQVLMGEGLTANQDFTNYQILKPRGTINIEDDKAD